MEVAIIFHFREIIFSFPLDPSRSQDSLLFSVRACGGSLNGFPTFFFPIVGG